MIRVVILYPKTSDSHFNVDYYLNHHIPLVRDIFRDLSLVKIEVDEGLANAFPEQPVPFASISYFTFDRQEDFMAGMGARGGEIIGDLRNFTNVQPQIQIDRVMIS
jgi:uncharacterized protein (TIGR02118 family)